MRSTALILALLCLSWSAAALEPLSPGPIRSRSGQFLVERWAPDTRPTLSTGAVQQLRLEPTPLAITCERIKATLLQEFQWQDQWSGVIALKIRPHASPDEPVRIVAIRFIDGWRYQVELPPEISEDRLMRAMVEVLLRERANRRAWIRPADVPRWLVTGLAAHLRAIHLGQLLIGPDTLEAGQRRRGDSLLAVRRLFLTQPPLPLERLSWPADADLSDSAAAFYEGSAHLLTYELLRLSRGREALSKTVDQLARYLNWQTAFLRSFEGLFYDFTDLERWWALTSVHYCGHLERVYWSNLQTSRQLEEILTVPVEVRLRADQLPMRSRAALQMVLSEWPQDQQRAILGQKLNHLRALSLRCHPEQAVLVGRYFETLHYYWQYRRGFVDVLTRPANSSVQAVARATIRRLNELDAERRGLRLPSGAQARR